MIIMIGEGIGQLVTIYTEYYLFLHLLLLRLGFFAKCVAFFWLTTVHNRIYVIMVMSNFSFLFITGGLTA